MITKSTIINKCFKILIYKNMKPNLQTSDVLNSIIDEYVNLYLEDGIVNRCVLKHCKGKYTQIKHQAKRLEKAGLIINKTGPGEKYNFTFCDDIHDMIWQLSLVENENESI